MTTRIPLVSCRIICALRQKTLSTDSLACEVMNCPSCVHDCQDVQDLGFTKSGVYHVTPPGAHDGFDIYCDMETDGGGWSVFQRRLNGTVDFKKTWNEYENGFGDITKDFWIGNIFLHIMTSRLDYQLRIDLQDWDGNTAHAKYKTFKIGSAYEKYRLDIGGYSGDAGKCTALLMQRHYRNNYLGDSLKYHNGRRFSTRDDAVKNEQVKNCVKRYMCGWWFFKCYTANLNGEYRHDGGKLAKKDKNKNVGIQWLDWKSRYYSMKAAEMKIKRL